MRGDGRENELAVTKWVGIVRFGRGAAGLGRCVQPEKGTEQAVVLTCSEEWNESIWREPLQRPRPALRRP
jgi:hypothetical protein